MSAKRRIALLFRGDPANDALTQAPRLRPFMTAMAEEGLAPEVLVYDETVEEEVRDRLLAVDGILVWADPISQGKDRRRLDPLLRSVSDRGVWVSGHPDVIARMGTKEVLYRTRHLGWGTDTHLYETEAEFRESFPVRLREAGVRVLKQHRGNGGSGVWRVELFDPKRVRVIRGRRDALPETVPLAVFLESFHTFLAEGGMLVDQAYQRRNAEGLIRCYFVHNEVIGFARQSHDTTAEHVGYEPFGLPSAKTMFEREDPQFATLRDKAEGEWVPAMQDLLGIVTPSLPVIWDADFLRGEKK